MTQLDDDLLPAIFDLIDELGVNATFYVQNDVQFDASTQKSYQSTPTPYVIKVSPPENVKKNDDEKDTHKVSCFIAGKDITFTPTLKMRWLYNSVKYTIESLETLRSGDSIAAYEVTSHRGN